MVPAFVIWELRTAISQQSHVGPLPILDGGPGGRAQPYSLPL